MPQHRPLARSDGRVNARLSPAGARPLPSTPSAEGTAWGRTPKPNKKRRRLGRGAAPRPCGDEVPVHMHVHREHTPWARTPPGAPCTEAPGPRPGSPAPRGHWAASGHICGRHTGAGAGMPLSPPQCPGRPRRGRLLASASSGQGDPAPISVGTCTRRGQHTLDPGVLGPGWACASGRPRPPAGRPRRGPSPALRVSVGFGRGRGGRERRRVPAAEWHLVTVTSPFVCRLNRSLGGYI